MSKEVVLTKIILETFLEESGILDRIELGDERLIIAQAKVYAFYWLRLSQYADDQVSRSKYKQISDTLYDMFMEEHQHIGEMFKS